MSIFYKSLINGLALLAFSVVCLGQQVGIVKTERNAPGGLVSFTENSKLTGISDAKHVDGYVKKYGSGLFTFPVGHNGVYRPFAAEADGIMGAYFQGDPGAASLPAGAPFATANKGDGVKTVGNKELWDIRGTKATKITLTWNAASDVNTLTGGTLAALSIVGWNPATSRWEKITSIVDQVSIFGAASSLTTGSITTTQTLVPDTYKAYTLAALTTVSLPANYSGTFEVAGCTEISGWVWDSNYPNSPLAVELVEGNQVYATATANIYRADLKDSGVGTGNYGFTMDLPASLLSDGLPHQLSVRVRSSNYILNGSPKTLACAFAGSFEKADCNDIQGWVWDKNTPDKAYTVELVENNVVHATTVANLYREDLKNTGIGTGNYGFKITIPMSLRDGKAHQLSIRVKGIDYTLPGSGKALTCSPPQYFGNFDTADCNGVITGWVWDKYAPNTALTVELYEGTTVYATTVANIYREVVKNAGFGTGNYGFSIPMPVALKDSQPHQLSIRVKGTSYILGGSPKAMTCSPYQFQGNLNTPDCNQIFGWVWDKNAPATNLTVEIYEGTTVYGTAVANIYREDVKNAGIGAGTYGFSIPTPAALKDGQAHQVSARVKGTSFVLAGSPKALTCAVNQFQGYLNVPDCNQITGWVWDKNAPNAAMTVELYEGTTVYGTVVANIYKESIKNAGIGTGNYGFTIPIPAALKDGQAHQLSVRVKGSSYNVEGGPRALTCAVSQFQGYVNTPDCIQITGWVWDKNAPANAQTVELYEGTTVYATALANIYSEPVKNAGYGTGNYAFSIPIPAALKDGQAHQLSVRVKGAGFILGGSPKALTCAVNQYQGTLNTPDCNQIFGWVWDKNAPATNLTVEIYEGTTVYGTAVANIYREDVKNAGIGAGTYGFSIPTPAALKDGQAHQVSARVKGTNFVLAGSPKALTCAVNQFQGYLNVPDCNQITGWVWDKNAPNAAMTVELYEGTTVYGTVVANIYKESIKNAGIGTGNYGFTIPIPAALKDGQAHQLSVRVKGSSYNVEGGPRALTCAVSQFQGYVNTPDCIQITGWVWDKNAPANAQTVELYEGTTVYATALANIYSEPVKNAGYGTGNYAFSIPIPAALKDGQAHQLSVRVKGAGFILGGSPKALTCAVNQYQGTLNTPDCNQIFGWVWDKNAPATNLTVEIYEGTTVYGTAVANIYREDVKNAGIGAGTYGFSIPTPAALKDGQAHQVSARVKGTNFVLAGSPKALTCAVNQFQGYLNVPDCNQITGWVWDKNAPNAAMTVELYEGTTVYGTVVANIYKESIKNAGIGTGNYGFTIPIPAALKDGQAHQLSVRVKGSSYNVEGGPRALTCAVSQFQGYVNTPDCIQITGWVWDKNAPANAQTVELYEGTTVYATALANIYSEPVKNAGYGTGNYAFSIPIPAALKDGQAHQLSVRVKGAGFILGGSPKALTCAVNQYQGTLNTPDCNQIFGWVWDKNAPATNLTVEIYEGTTVYGTAVANIYREDVKNAGIGAGTYGFSIPTPAALKDGQAHQVSARVKGTNFVLAGSPKALTCAVNQFQGYLNVPDCNQITGWVWDKNAPNAAMTVELYEGTTVYGTVVANIYKESVKNAGFGTGNYGFTIPIPAALKDGAAHQLNVRVKGSSFNVTGGPRTLTCAASARLAADSVSIEAVVDEISLMVAPNPTRGKMLATLTLPAGESAELSIANLKGDIVWRQKIEGVGEQYQQWVDLSNHTDGVYIVMLKTSASIKTKRIILVK